MSTHVLVKDVFLVDVFKKLDDLSPLSEALNRESEDLNDIIEKVQKRLAELSLGVEVHVDLSEKDIIWSPTSSGDETEGKPAWLITKLAYERSYGQWALWVYENTYLEDPYYPGDFTVLKSESPPRKLLDSSREIRIDALAKMPDLIDNLQQAATEKLEKLRKAKSEVSE